MLLASPQVGILARLSGKRKREGGIECDSVLSLTAQIKCLFHHIWQTSEIDFKNS